MEDFCDDRPVTFAPHIDDGGPAFPAGPRMARYLGDGSFEDVHDRGMSLRDWFAGQALTGMAAGFSTNAEMAAMMTRAANLSGVEPHDAICQGAYEFADAMLAARKPKTEA